MLSNFGIRVGLPFSRRSNDQRSPQQILIIAGPSGSGKSTFLREFVEGRLSPNVSNYLPAEAKVWRRTSANEITKNGLPAMVGRGDQYSGLVVHYDIMRALTRGFENYAADPAIQAITQTPAALTVITILPSREILFEQFLARARTEEYEEWWGKPEIRRRVKLKMRAALYKLVGKTPKLLKEGQLLLLSAYSTDEKLNRWVDRWESFLERLRQGRNNVQLVYVAPDPQVAADTLQGNRCHPCFRLLRIGQNHER